MGIKTICRSKIVRDSSLFPHLQERSGTLQIEMHLDALVSSPSLSPFLKRAVEELELIYSHCLKMWEKCSRHVCKVRRLLYSLALKVH